MTDAHSVTANDPLVVCSTMSDERSDVLFCTIIQMHYNDDTDPWELALCWAKMRRLHRGPGGRIKRRFDRLLAVLRHLTLRGLAMWVGGLVSSVLYSIAYMQLEDAHLVDQLTAHVRQASVIGVMNAFELGWMLWSLAVLNHRDTATINCIVWR